MRKAGELFSQRKARLSSTARQPSKQPWMQRTRPWSRTWSRQMLGARIRNFVNRLFAANLLR
eukprot:2681395-Pyramimonas_sp.AAC.1